MNIMKRKRWRFEEEETKNRNLGKLEKVISEIVENEKHNLKEEMRERYKETYREFYHEHNELKKLNQALDYKAQCFEQMYNKIVEKRDDELKQLYKKIDCFYCVSCDDCSESRIVCANGHSNCRECIENGLNSYITYQTVATKEPKCLKCQIPLDEKHVANTVDGDLWGRFISERTRMDFEDSINKNSITVKDNYTIKRPCCGRPMIDFEGCASLSCEYCNNSFYCAFCLKKYDNSDDCHKHVSHCEYNTQPTYHIISECQIISLKQCWKNILMKQLSESLNFDLPNPVYTSNLD
jgi:hypothetical protein